VKLAIAAIALLALGVSTPALANAQLAEEKQCMQCHAMDRGTIGPSFQTIKAVYQRMKNPEASLMAVIKEGNDANLGPHWGRARMPNGSERPRINDREARQLARWILS
jgi:cytochrome c